MKKEIINEILFDLAGLTPDWIDEKYNNLYTRWKFNNSDEIWIDGELIDKNTKRAIQISLYNIQPPPKEIIVSELKDGFPLTEKMFIDKMIRKLSKFNDADYPDDTWQMRINLFLEFLKQKQKTLDSQPAPAPKPIQLIKSLSENQQSYLFNKLTESGLFMPTETDYNSFCFVFGNSIRPDVFIPLKWLQNKQLLRELINELKHPDIEITKNRYSLPAFFIDTKEKSILYLPTNKAKDDILSTKIQEISIKLRQTK